jgi:thiol-disulfide isomerase/thioredoxin
MFRSSLQWVALAAALGAAPLRAADPVPAALPAAASAPAPAAVPISTGVSTNRLPDDPEKAYRAFEASLIAPRAPAEWNQKPPTTEERLVFRGKMAAGAALAADNAREFIARFPAHRNVPYVKTLQRELLKASVQLGAKDRVAELQALGAEDPHAVTEPVPGPFEKRLRGAISAAQKLEDQGLEAMFSALEKDIRVIQKEFPDRGEVYDPLMEIAQLSSAERARPIVEEILKSEIANPDTRATATVLKRKLDRIGKALNVQFTAIDGRTVNLAEMKGKVVLVDFWATWCGPCVRELPNVLAAYSKLNPKGFEIVGISSDDDLDELKQFVGRNKMPWAQYFEATGRGNRFAVEYEISGIPTMWLVDKKGNLREINARGDLEKRVEKLLAED